jgi:hypothetical protein
MSGMLLTPGFASNGPSPFLWAKWPEYVLVRDG